MNEKVTIFSAVKVFYDTGNDLIGVFGNLILLTIPEGKFYSISAIQSIFFTKINFNIPKDTIRTILKRLKRYNLVSYENIKNDIIESIKLTDEGKNAKVKIKQDYDNAQRENNALVEGVKIFLDKKGFACSDEDIKKELIFFIDNNSSSAIFTLEREPDVRSVISNELQRHIADFFVFSEKTDKENFQRLKAILFGQIISSVFLNQKRVDAGVKIQKLVLYLDTNIVFSLLGLHEDFYNEPANEVADLIKKAGGILKIFSFTKDEVTNKLRGYLREYGYYSSNIQVDSIYHILKKKNRSQLDVMILIENIESELQKIGIEIDYSFREDDLLRGREDEFSMLGTYKQFKPASSIKHDLALIFAVKELRDSRSFYSWEKARYICLSADIKLAHYDFEKHGHRELNTFPEIVYRSDMASMLWLKGYGGSDNAFMHNFFAQYLREKVINTNLWQKFIEEIRKKRANGVITDRDIEDIISLSETEKILREKGVSGIEDILNDEKISERRKSSLKKDQENSKNEEIILKQAKLFEDILNGITRDCQDLWKKRIDVVVYLIAVFLFLVVCCSIYYFGLSLVANIIQVSTIVLIFVVAGSIIQKKEFRILGFLIGLRSEVENKKIISCIDIKKKKYKINFKD